MIQRTACPRCRSNGGDSKGDNLICYSDGGMHCFACGYHEHSNSKRSVESQLERFSNTQPAGFNSGVNLPNDLVFDPAQIPRRVMQWLAKYNITKPEFQGWNLCYSPSLEMLIFPGMVDDVCEYWIGRNFGDGPKYHTVGPIGKYPVIFEAVHSQPPDTIIAVEDFVSAIKVSRHCDAVCVFSGTLRRKQAVTLSKRYKHLIIWGDYDKTVENMRLAKQDTSLFKTSRSNMTTKDPKEYSNEEIIRQINK